MSINQIAMFCVLTLACHVQNESAIYASLYYFYSMLRLVDTFMDIYVDLFLIFLLLKLVSDDQDEKERIEKQKASST